MISTPYSTTFRYKPQIFWSYTPKRRNCTICRQNLPDRQALPGCRFHLRRVQWRDLGSLELVAAQLRVCYRCEMQILPVLDLLAGVVVRGVAGQRSHYRPIASRLCSDPAPQAVANSLRTEFGFSEFYVADLDAIQFGYPNFEVYRTLAADGFRLWIDAGVRDAALPVALLSAGAESIIVGLETCARPDTLAAVCQSAGASRVVFSLDLQDGRPLGDLTEWKTESLESIVEQAVTAGITRLIVLDLAQVGVRGGLSTLELCQRVKAAHPQLQLTTGGGVRDLGDLERLESQGIDRVLVATALHDGSLSAADLSRFR